MDIMGRGGSFNFREFEQMAKNLEKLAKEKDKLFQDAAKELASRPLALVIPQTPVGDYPSGSGMVGGTLRRGWVSATQEEAFTNRKREPGAKDIQEFLSTIQIECKGDFYTIEVADPVDYASYVESGHRQKPGRYVPAIGKQLKKSWVEGKLMMKESVQDLQKIAPKVLEKRIEKFLRECMDGR